jgi:hypothetical protein
MGALAGVIGMTDTRVEAQTPPHSLLVPRSTVARVEPRTRAEMCGAIAADTRIDERSRRGLAGDRCGSWSAVGAHHVGQDSSARIKISID